MDKRQYSGAGPSATLLWQFLTFSKAILILLAFPQQGTLPVQWLTCEPELPLIQSKPCHLACGPKLLMSALFASFTAADILHLALIAHALLHLRQTELLSFCLVFSLLLANGFSHLLWRANYTCHSTVHKTAVWGVSKYHIVLSFFVAETLNLTTKTVCKASKICIDTISHPRNANYSPARIKYFCHAVNGHLKKFQIKNG